MPIQPPERTIDRWRSLFEAVHRKTAPTMTYSKGWFRVPLRRAAREADVLRWTQTLERRLKLRINSEEQADGP